ncbi:MAG: putative sugar nucleotidyl transferase [Candidatus Kapaibacterium sp.]
MKIDQIILLEPKSVENFYPFSVLHCIWEIRCGALRIFEKIQKILPDSELIFSGRTDHLASFLARENITNRVPREANTLILYAGSLINNDFKALISETYAKAGGEGPLVLKTGNDLLGMYLPGEFLQNNPGQLDNIIVNCVEEDQFNDFNKADIAGVNKINYLYDAIYENAEAIFDDQKILDDSFDSFYPVDWPATYAVNPGDILIADSVNISPGVVINATEGPVIIDEGAKIMAHASIIGPCYIGKNSTIKIGAKIYEDCSFGPNCKIGGELENTIIHGYSNKQHDGFLGHSYIGEWVNFGADTNNSDLKNTYGNIKIRIEDREIDTGKMFLGLLCGDHTKSGINTMFTTGTVAGICGILVKEWFLPNFIPSFSWGGGKNSPTYKSSKAIETARKVMARRSRELLPEEEKLILAEYKRIAG